MQQQQQQQSFGMETEAVIKKVTEDILSVGPDLEYSARYDLRISLELTREQYLALKRAERNEETFEVSLTRLQQEMDLSRALQNSGDFV